MISVLHMIQESTSITRISLPRLLLVISLTHATVFGQQESKPERTAVQVMTPATDSAIQRGLSYIATHQNDDGSFGTGAYSRNVAICGLCGMSFMSAGNTPGRGPYGGHADRCISFLLENTQDSGFITYPSAASHGPMYGHGFATLYLAEVYGMSRHPEIREKLSKAVKLIIQTQNNEGGWRYHPRRNDADVSVTICQIMALRAARNAGIYVPNETIDRCVDYIKQSQNPDGGFIYNTAGDGSQFPRSAAGVVALYSAGIYEGDEITKGLDYLVEHAPRGGDVRSDHHYFYGQYYAMQAMWHAGGQYWSRWYPQIRDEIIDRQQEDGSWIDPMGPVYGTAMATLVLQMPNNFLSIFQR